MNTPMEKTVWRHVIALHSVLGICVYSLAADCLLASEAEPAHSVHMQVFEACTTALTNIHRELQNLGKRFPQFDNVASAKISAARPTAGQESLSAHHHLEYQKTCALKRSSPTIKEACPHPMKGTLLKGTV